MPRDGLVSGTRLRSSQAGGATEGPGAKEGRHGVGILLSVALQPDYEPRIGELTSRLRLNIGGVEFIADVSLPTCQVVTLIEDRPCKGYEDRGQAGDKIAKVIDAKATRYAPLD